RGAYVFRHGLLEAVTVFRQSEIEDVTIVTKYESSRMTEAVKLHPVDVDCTVWEMAIPGEGAEFVDIYPEDDDVRATESSRRRVTVTLPTGAVAAGSVFYHSGGMTRRLDADACSSVRRRSMSAAG